MTAKIKLNAASGGGSISIQAPSSSSNNRVISLPDIADGTLLTSQSSLDSTKLSPAIAAGITMADQWRISTSYSASSGASTLTANWERNDTTGFAGIGSAMTQSSGIFSFPSTGIYLIRFYSRGFGGNVQYAGNYIQTGISGTYTTVADSFDSAGNSSNYYFNNSTEALFDVTNTSTHTVRFAVETSASVAYDGNSGQNVTYVTFMRLGDT
tara:strand:+ start:10 stop:642 length:633 start_codon:yes stop_codon:yes gene_type:complete